MDKNIRWFFVCFLLIAALVLVFYNLNHNNNNNNLQLTYQVDLSSISPDMEKQTIEDTMAALKARLAAIDIKKPYIKQDGRNQIIVRIPESDITQLQKENLIMTALLEFREQVDVTDTNGQVTGQKWVPATAVINGETKILNSGYFKSNTSVTRDSNTGTIQLIFEWTDEGAQISVQVTTRLLNKPLGIFVGSGDAAQPLLSEDGEPFAPVVNAVISDKGEIDGLSLNEAQALSEQLNAGRLPAPLTLIDEKLLD